MNRQAIFITVFGSANYYKHLKVNIFKIGQFLTKLQTIEKKFSRIIEKIDFDLKNGIAAKSQKKIFSAHKKNTCLITSIKEQHI